MRIGSTAAHRLALVFVGIYLVASAMFAWMSIGLGLAGMRPTNGALNAIAHLSFWIPTIVSLLGFVALVSGRRPTTVLWANAVLWIVLGVIASLNSPLPPQEDLNSSVVFMMSLISLACVWYLLATRQRGKPRDSSTPDEGRTPAQI